MRATSGRPFPFRTQVALLMLALLVLLPGCASTGKQASALERAQYAWTGAVRWNDMKTAWQLVDPEVRRQKPLTDVDFSRYKQVQISGYRDRGMSTAGDGAVVRDIEIGVINRNTLAERTVRYRERWRYDEQAGTWWLLSGLPDLWGGE